MDTKTGRSPSGRTGRASPEPASSLGHSATIPNAGDWVVISEGRWKGATTGETYGVGQVERATGKTVTTRSDVHYRRRHDLHLATLVSSKDAGERLVDRLRSAKAEADQRIRAAHSWVITRQQALLASAIEAQSAMTEGHGPKDESAVAEPDAHA